MSNPTPAPRNQKEQYELLHSEVADILLGPDSPVRGSTEFDELIAEHDRLQSRQAELQALDAKLVEVLPGLEQAETQLAAAEKQLAAEKKKLAGFAGELGKAAFAGLRAGELPDNPLFADRKELQSRIETLQRQKAELVAGENAGMMEKAKLQAQQLKLTGQIKVEELKIGSADRALGTALLTSKEKPAIQCNQTEDVLEAIANQRKQVATARENVRQVEQTVGDHRAYAAKVLDRSKVEEAATLKAELKDVRKEEQQNQKVIHKARQSTIDEALKSHTLDENTRVSEKLRELEALAESSAATTPQTIKLIQSVYSRWQILPINMQIGIASIPIVALTLFMAVGYFRGGASNQFDETMGDASPFRIVEQIEDANKSSKVDGARGDDTPASLHGAPVAPGIAKWAKWPQPDEVVAEMGSLTMLQATKPVNHGFTVLQQISDGVYEIQIESPIQSKGRAVLSTVTATFESDGRAVLPLTYSGTQSFSLENGFQRQIRVFREAAGLSPKEAAIREREYFDEMKDLRRMLVCSSIHFSVPITAEWKDFHATVGADKWEEMISEDSLYLSKRTKDYFSIEVTGAYRETKGSLENKLSPVHYAASVRALSLLDQLTLFGEDPSGLGDCRRSPLHIAIESYLRNRKFKSDQDFDTRHLTLILDRFEAHGVDANEEDSNGRNLLHVVGVQVPGSGVVEIANICSTIQLLSQHGIDIRHADEGGLTPLHLAVIRSLGRSSSEMPVNYRELYGESPRDLKRSDITTKILASFLDQGADINAKDRFGNTALHVAAGCGQVDIIKAILEKGGDRKLRNENGDTPAAVLRKSFPNLQPGTNDLAYFRQALGLLE